MKAREKAWEGEGEREREKGEKERDSTPHPSSSDLSRSSLRLGPRLLCLETRGKLWPGERARFLAAPTFLDNARTSVIKVMFPRRREVTPTSTSAASASCLLCSSLF